MKSVEVRFIPRGKTIEETFVLQQDDDKYVLSSASGVKLALLYTDGIFSFEDKDSVEESPEVVADRLLGVSQDWLEMQDQGIESDGEPEPEEPFELDQLYVEQKQFSITELINMISGGDIELFPDFQRSFIWDCSRQSKLIESALIGYPLPALYLSQYDDGRMTVVDGLQRLNTIVRFLNDDLVLTGFGVLREYNGKRYSEIKKLMSPLRLRRFMQTQVLCFILDYRSPIHVKYDLFRRLNTGGKPLSNAEIRNCLSRPALQQTIRSMVHSTSYLCATKGSIKGIRMEDRDLALRFMYFWDQYTEESPLGNYNGYIEQTLDAYTEELGRKKDFSVYVTNFDHGMSLAYQLFHHDAFRKVREGISRRPQINKLLYVVVTVLLAKNYSRYMNSGKIRDMVLTDKLADAITNNENLFWALSGSTSSKANMDFVFRYMKNDFFDKYLA